MLKGHAKNAKVMTEKAKEKAIKKQLEHKKKHNGGSYVQWKTGCSVRINDMHLVV